MRTSIPSFRLLTSVLDEECQTILDFGVDIRYNSPIKSMRDLLSQGFDAIFVGSGAPRGKELELPGRHDTDRIRISIDWLESMRVRPPRQDRRGRFTDHQVLGNTAMDCCRSSRTAWPTTLK